MNERYEEAMNRYLASNAYLIQHAEPPAIRPPGHQVRKVLVTWESKHGSTAEISFAIAGVLRANHLRVSLAPVTEADMDEDFDAYVIGSAVYAGHWMKHAKQFVHDNRAKLLSRPVWLFSSGPIGRPAKPEEAPVDIAEVFEATAPHEHKIFAGKLDRDLLSFPERAITRALHAPYGDFREWPEIEAWAAHIAQAVAAAEPAKART